MKNAVSGILFALLFTSILVLSLRIQPVGADAGTIYIRADGSVDPPTAPISTIDNITYVFTDSIINDSVVVERDNIVIDGTGHTVVGTGISDGTKGIDLTGRTNITIENTYVTEFYLGIYLSSSSYNVISGNSMTGNNQGIEFENSTNNSASGNNITSNAIGIYLESSSDNSMSGNKIASNLFFGILLESSSNNSIGGNTFSNGGLTVLDSYGNVVVDNVVNGKPLVYLEDVSDYSVGDAGQVVLVDCNRIKVENLTIAHTDIGMELWQTNNTSISGSTIANNIIGGIDFENSTYNTVSGNNITSNNLLGPIVLDFSSNNSIYHNNFISNTHEVVNTGSTNVWDSGYPSGGNYWSDYNGNDTFSGPNQNVIGSDGIGDTPYVINANNIDQYPLMKPYAGPTQLQVAIIIYIKSDGSISPSSAPISSVDNVTYTLTGNITSDASGIVIERDNITLNGAGYTLQGPGNETYPSPSGIDLSNRNNVTIEQVEITGFCEGILLGYSNNDSISENNVSMNDDGIACWYSSNNDISENNANENTVGISLTDSLNNRIARNTVNNNFNGIMIFFNNSNDVSGNNITGNSGYGIEVSDSSNNSIAENNINTNSFGINLNSYSTDNNIARNNINASKYEGITLDKSFSNRICENNITNNRLYGIDLHSSSDNNSVSDNNISGNGYGIFLTSCSNTTISGNNMTHDNLAMNLKSSCANSTISGNNIANCLSGVCLYDSCSNNNVCGNNLTANNIGFGIELDSNCSDNSISGNNITDFFDGLYLARSCGNNSFSENNVAGNSEYGVGLDSCSGNKFYHNNFMNNTFQAKCLASTNVWDSGYPNGGNYWSDYNGNDSFRGPHQNLTGSDGIGDTPYTAGNNNIDNYPLVNPWTPHNVLVTAVAADCTWIYQGRSASINVTVWDNGDFPENVTVTLYYNLTAGETAGAQNVTLLSGENVTLLFVWNTAGVPPCYTNYTLTAVATLPTGTNALSDGNITVRTMGDINGDGKIDMKDIAIVAGAFGSHGPNVPNPSSPASSKWNPNADIAGLQNSATTPMPDGKVDLCDIVEIAVHFGQHYP